MRYTCYECKKEVPEEHFIAEDGRILCKECSKGVKECSDRVKQILKQH